MDALFYDFDCVISVVFRTAWLVLLVTCMKIEWNSNSWNFYIGLLQKVLDPPHPQVVEDALDILVHISALARTSTRGRYYEPTFYGRLLASFSLSFDASVLLLKFGDIGLLREGILIAILMDAQPLPILHPFGEEHLVLPNKWTFCVYLLVWTVLCFS